MSRDKPDCLHCTMMGHGRSSVLTTFLEYGSICLHYDTPGMEMPFFRVHYILLCSWSTFQSQSRATPFHAISIIVKHTRVAASASRFPCDILSITVHRLTSFLSAPLTTRLLHSRQAYSPAMSFPSLSTVSPASSLRHTSSSHFVKPFARDRYSATSSAASLVSS